jgi:hypothetical protein
MPATALQVEKENCHEYHPCLRRVGSRTHRDALAHAEESFRGLLGEVAWRQLPRAVQRRFERDFAPGESVVYHGYVVSTERTIAGRLWSQALRIVGAPLPLGAMKRATSTVVVTADADAHGQCWTRMYHQPRKLPQVIRSRKLFAGSTGLEEQVGGGICMALNVTVELQTLVFRSAGFHWRCSHVKLPLPAWLTPGSVEVRHREEREGLFSFVLTIAHPWFGRVFRQIAYYRDGE